MHGSPGGLARIDALFGGQGYTNTFSNAPVPFGAFPSLHAGCSTMEALFLTHFFPTVERVLCVAQPAEAANLVRMLCEKVPKGIRWREARGRILAESVSWEKASEEEGADVGSGKASGTLVVEGVVRGSRMNANRLVHLQGFGDFKIDEVRTFSPATPRPSTN